MLIALGLMVGLVIGYARGGRLRTASLRRPKRLRLLLTALALYTLGILGGLAWSPLLSIFTALCGFTLAYFAWVNHQFRGARLVAIGLAGNAFVLLINGGIPVSTSAAARAGVSDPGTVADGMHVPAADAVLPWLGEVIPVAFPLLPQVASPGDLILAAGLALVASSALPAPAASTRSAPNRAATAS